MHFASARMLESAPGLNTTLLFAILGICLHSDVFYCIFMSFSRSCNTWCISLHFNMFVYVFMKMLESEKKCTIYSEMQEMQEKFPKMHENTPGYTCLKPCAFVCIWVYFLYFCAFSRNSFAFLHILMHLSAFLCICCFYVYFPLFLCIFLHLWHFMVFSAFDCNFLHSHAFTS